MTAEREVMTLERQAFENWASDKLLGGGEKRIAWLTWQAALSNLARAAEPVFHNVENFSSKIEHGELPHPPEPARDAKIGAVVWQFIDRMNDVAECDPADKILADFVAAVNPIIAAMAQESGE